MGCGSGSRSFRRGLGGIVKPGFGRVHVQKLYGQAFLRGKYTRLPGASRKLHGRMRWAQSRGAEKKAEERRLEEEINVDFLGPSPGRLFSFVVYPAAHGAQ
jgi:hypothetical protein